VNEEESNIKIINLLFYFNATLKQIYKNDYVMLWSIIIINRITTQQQHFIANTRYVRALPTSESIAQ
jgi:hypothetical protein